MFRVHPVGEDGEVCERLLPLVRLALRVRHVIPRDGAERLADQRGVITTVDDRVLLHVVRVAVVNVTAVLENMLLGMGIVGVLTVDEVRLTAVNDIAVVSPERHPGDAAFLQAHAERKVKRLLQRRRFLDGHLGPVFVIPLDPGELRALVAALENLQPAIESEFRHHEVVFELRLLSHRLGHALVPVRDTPEVEQIAELNKLGPCMAHHVLLDGPQRPFVIPRNVHVGNDDDVLNIHFLSHGYPHTRCTWSWHDRHNVWRLSGVEAPPFRR